MNKFKTGDKVKVVKNWNVFLIGDTCTVTSDSHTDSDGDSFCDIKRDSDGEVWTCNTNKIKLVTRSRKPTKKEITIPPKKGMTVFDKDCDNEGKIIMFDDKTCVYEEASGSRDHKSWDRIEVRIPVRPEEKVKKVKRKKKGGK